MNSGCLWGPKAALYYAPERSRSGTWRPTQAHRELQAKQNKTPRSLSAGACSCAVAQSEVASACVPNNWSRNCICGRTDTEGQKIGVQCAFWGFGSFFLKRTIEGSSRYNCRHNPDSATGLCPFKRPRLALSELRPTLKCSNVLLTSCSPFSRCPRPRVLKSTEVNCNFRGGISTILYIYIYR